MDSVKRTLRPSSDNQSYTTQGGLNRFSIWRNRFIGGKAEWAVTVERLVSMYQAIGVSSVHLLDLVVTELSPRLAQVFVRWALNDGSSTMLYAFEAV